MKRNTKKLKSKVSFYKKTDKVDIVCHSNAEYVKGNIFTNNMEGFWSHFQRTEDEKKKISDGMKRYWESIPYENKSEISATNEEINY